MGRNGLPYIALPPNAKKIEVMEELLHARQYMGHFKGEVDDVLNSLIARGVKGDKAWAAREIHAKGLLLQHADSLGFNSYDRLYLQRQIDRLWRYGVSKGY